MSSYLIHFLVYALAMVGVIFVCMLVFKKSLVNNKFAKNTSDLCIENALNLSQRKTLYVIKAGNEKFLIASDIERTSFLAKLNEKEPISAVPSSFSSIYAETQNSRNNNEEQIETVQQKVIDYSDVLASLNQKGGKKPVLKELMRKLNTTPSEKS